MSLNCVIDFSSETQTADSQEDMEVKQQKTKEQAETQTERADIYTRKPDKYGMPYMEGA